MVCAAPAAATPPAPIADSWAGPYIGAYFTAAAGGRTSETTDQNVLSPGSSLVVHGDLSGRASGSMVDLFVGRNWRFGDFVVGGQVEATLSGVIDANSFGPFPSTQIRTDNNGVITTNTVGFTTKGNDVRLNFRAGLIGRAGFLARPDLLLYGLAGLEFGHFIFVDGDDQFGSPNRSLAVGYTVGAGVEARYDQNWSVRAEYRYLHYNTGRYEDLLRPPSILTTTRNDDLGIHVGKLSLVYRFGESGPLAAMAAIPRTSQQVWADSWAGPYAGIYFAAGAGHAAGVTNVGQSSVTNSGANVSTSNAAATSVLAGDMNGSMNELFLGYNWRNGNVVVGVQAEGTVFSDVAWKQNGPQTIISSSSNNGVVSPLFVQTGPGFDNQQLTSAIGLIGRVGFLATPELLLYGLAGLEFGHFAYPFTIGGGDNGKWAAGYTAGAGAELRINDHWSLRGEYRYMHFGVDRNESQPQASTNLISGTSGAGTTVTQRQSVADFHVGKIGVVYKFGGAGPASAMAAIPSSVTSRWADGWAGPYIGAYFGAGAGIARGSLTGRADESQGRTFLNDETLAGTTTGTQVDLFAGYNARSDRLLAGGQIEATQFSDVRVKTSGVMIVSQAGIDGYQASTFDNTQRLRSMIGVVGRVGFLASPDLLLYGLGGLALGHITYPDAGGTRYPDPDGKWVTGYTAGFGGEMKIAPHWSLRGEYRYLHFDVTSGANWITASGNPPNITTNSLVFRTATDFHLGKVGLVYRFGGDPAAAMAAMPGRTVACCDRWAGFSAGVYAAAGMGQVRDAMNNVSDTGFVSQGVQQFGTHDVSSGLLSGDIKGGVIDLFAGYNWRAGKVVVGGQVEATVYSDVEMKSRGRVFITSTSLVPPFTVDSGDSPVQFQQTLRSRAGLIGRLGVLATDKLLLYGLAGAEFGHFAFLDNRDLLGGEDGKWAFGTTIGAGGELKLTDRWSLRAEYRHLRFDLDRNSLQVSNSIAPGSAFTNIFATTVHTRADFNLAKLGAAYTFCYCE